MVKRRTSTKASARKRAAKRRRAAQARYHFHNEGTSPKAKPKRARRSRAKWKRASEIAGHALRISMVGAAVLVFLTLVFFAQLTQGLPDTSELFATSHEPAITVMDTQGEKIGTRGLTQGAHIRLDEMPRSLPLAVLAIEDRRFYHHIGIDFVGLTRAAFTNLAKGRIVEGGSTISQQLAKILFLSPERTFRRKLQEAMLALWLEHNLTKDQILEIYLNRVYLGAGTYGVEAAAQRYFGKSARGLSLVESAMLAGLLKAPSRYSPTNSIAEAGSRTAMVLNAMVDAGFITSQERAQANQHPAHIVAATASQGADYVLDWVISQLQDYIGKPTQDLIVQTSVDMRLQRAAEDALVGTLNKSGTSHHVGQGALVAMTPDGAVKAMVGGASYARSAYNRATQSRRSPGSAFKPFVYLAAIEAGYRPDDIVIDEPIRIGNWQPSNYTGRYLGPMTLENAFAQSINSVAARLGETVGRAHIIDIAQSFGIASPLKPVPSLALGSEGVGVLELTGAYAPFANGGRAVIPHAILRVLTKGGKTIYERRGAGGGQVADIHSIGTMNRMFEHVVEDGTGRAAHVPGQIVAGKTGTGQDNRDAWFVGFTAHMVAGVWLGNDDFSPMKHVTGGNLPARVFSQFMVAANQGLPTSELPGVVPEPMIPSPPEGLTSSTRPVQNPEPEDGGFGAFLRSIGRILSGLPSTSVN